jgi:hypothetical protein
MRNFFIKSSITTNQNNQPPDNFLFYWSFSCHSSNLFYQIWKNMLNLENISGQTIEFNSNTISDGSKVEHTITIVFFEFCRRFHNAWYADSCCRDRCYFFRMKSAYHLGFEFHGRTLPIRKYRVLLYFIEHLYFKSRTYCTFSLQARSSPDWIVLFWL